MSLLKESEMIRCGSVHRIMGLSMSLQLQMWDSIGADNYAKYIQSTVGLSLSIDKNLKNVPIKFYCKHNSVLEVVQDLVGYSPDDGTETTLIDAFNLSFDAEPTEETALGDTKNFVLHGIEVPHNTPLLWLTTNLLYADGFLHVIVMSIKD